MMRNALRLLAIALFAGFLAGCYVMVDDGVGSVGIEMPDANSTGDPSPETLARIYLLNGTQLVPVGDDTPFKLVALESEDNEVSIGPVPSGPDYQVILALGDIEPGVGDTEVFVPARYAVSDSFTVVAGQATPIDLTPVESKFSYVPTVFGEDLVGIAKVARGPANPGDVYFYTATTTEAIELNTSYAVTARATLPAGEEATGVDVGALVTETYPVPWINTDSGLLPYLGGNSFSAAEVDFDADYTGESAIPPVLDSGAFRVERGSTGYYDLFGWFQTDAGLGGVYDEDDALIGGDGPKQWVADIDLSEFISGQPITDLVVDIGPDGVDAYFASKLGAFKLPKEVLIDGLSTVPDILDAATFFDVVVDGEAAVITQLAQVGAKLYLGTNKGVVSILTADIELDSIPTSDVVTESLGRTVRDMAIGSNYQAILTDNFLIVSGPATNYTAVPIYAGIVTAPTGLYLDDSSGVVLIAGETGIAAVDIDDL